MSERKLGFLRGRKRCFGIPLEVYWAKFQRLPKVVDQCLRYLEESFLEEEGLFRLAGSEPVIRNCKKVYDQGKSVDLRAAGCDAHGAASLIARYLRELPESLIPPQSASQLSGAMALSEEKRIPASQMILSSLPYPHRMLLKKLMCLFYHISQHSDVNKMTPGNLAMVLSPNIVKNDNPNPLLALRESADIAKTLRFLIENFPELFANIEEMEEKETDNKSGKQFTRTYSEARLVNRGSKDAGSMPQVSSSPTSVNGSEEDAAHVLSHDGSKPRRVTMLRRMHMSNVRRPHSDSLSSKGGHKLARLHQIPLFEYAAVAGPEGLVRVSSDMTARARSKKHEFAGKGEASSEDNIAGKQEAGERKSVGDASDTSSEEWIPIRRPRCPSRSSLEDADAEADGVTPTPGITSSLPDNTSPTSNPTPNEPSSTTTSPSPSSPSNSVESPQPAADLTAASPSSQAPKPPCEPPDANSVPAVSPTTTTSTPQRNAPQPDNG